MKRNKNKVKEELDNNTLYKLLNVERVATEQEIVYKRYNIYKYRKNPTEYWPYAFIQTRTPMTRRLRKCSSR